jgi:hypothetical protein
MPDLRRPRRDEFAEFDDRESGDGLELDSLVESLLGADDEDEEL